MRRGLRSPAGDSGQAAVGVIQQRDRTPEFGSRPAQFGFAHAVQIGVHLVQGGCPTVGEAHDVHGSTDRGDLVDDRAQAVALIVGVREKIIVAATGVGLLTGFFGVGGGSAIVPALVLALGFDMPAAVGTSLLVIAINSATALAARLGSLAWPRLAAARRVHRRRAGRGAGRNLASRPGSTRPG